MQATRGAWAEVFLLWQRASSAGAAASHTRTGRGQKKVWAGGRHSGTARFLSDPEDQPVRIFPHTKSQTSPRRPSIFHRLSSETARVGQYKQFPLANDTIRAAVISPAGEVI